MTTVKQTQRSSTDATGPKEAEALTPASRPDPRRWRALSVLALIQFVLVLDVSVVNTALPQIQTDLRFSRAGLVWVVNGYALMAGGLLLLGGRLADVFGRRRLFLIGLGLFAAASAVSGSALTPGMLLAGRFAQGAGEALAAPAALGLIVVLFPDTTERVKAVGVWGGLTGLGGTTGAVIGGALTDLADWRFIFFLNLPVAAVVLVMVPRLVAESRMVREQRRLDVTGAVTATGGLLAVVYGLMQAGSHPWGSNPVLLPLLSGMVLLAALVVVEAHSPAPLIPLRFFTNRTRVTANAVSLLGTAAFFTYILLMTLFLQQVLHYSALRAGLSYLPLGLGVGAGVALSMALMPRLGVKIVLAVGFVGAALGLLLSGGIDIESSYPSGVLPGMAVLGIFIGMSMPATVNAALHRTTGQDSSLASGVQNTMQQVGGALGLAVLATLASRHELALSQHDIPHGVAATDGYVLAFRVAAAVLVVAAALALFLIEDVTTQRRDPIAEAPPEPALRPVPAPPPGRLDVPTHWPTPQTADARHTPHPRRQ